MKSFFVARPILYTCFCGTTCQDHAPMLLYSHTTMTNHGQQQAEHKYRLIYISLLELIVEIE